MAPPDPLAERPPWLARLLLGDGYSVAGAGVLVSRRHLLTCAHVVGLQLGRPERDAGTGPRPVETVRVEFPFADASARYEATVVSWHPLRPDGDGDVAVRRPRSPSTRTPRPTTSTANATPSPDTARS